MLAEPVQPLAAPLQQRVALAVAQLLRAHQAGELIAMAGDAVAGEHAAHHPFPRIRRAMSCAGAGLRRPSSSSSISGWSMGLKRIRSGCSRGGACRWG
ncbi:hypothetical protein VB716_11645, partial [Synechococcus sp. CCY9201]|uniref:hypothetical protein n=1 Tax=Synechococcus sp. CCY9201 TaxID=174697 RepID=UPI002B216F82